MAWVSLSATQGERPAASAKARRSYQHQKLTHTERGNSWGMCAPIPAVVHDKTQDRPVLRAGIAPNLQTCRRPRVSGLSRIHLRGSAVKAASRHSHSVRVLGSTPSRAQSLANQHLHKLAVAKINHLSNFSLGLTDLAASCATKGLGNVRKAFGEIRNV